MKTVALVGCGRISARHIEAIQSHSEQLKIIMVCDVDISKAQNLAAKINVPFGTDYKTIRGADIIAVLTPSGLHPRHAAEIAENTDCKAILCEKPISLTIREAYELFRRIEKSGKRLLPIYQNRYNPLVQHLKTLINSGRLGKMHMFNCNVLWNRNDDYFKIDWHGTRELDGGVLYTQASHYVDMLHFLFGEIDSHKGIGESLRQLEVYDSLSAVMRFKSGIIGSLNATVSVYEKNYQTEFTLVAEKGTIRLSGTNLNQIDFWNVEGLEKPNLDFELTHQYGKGHNTLYQYIVNEQWEMFPSKEDVLSGIRLMEMLSY